MIKRVYLYSVLGYFLLGAAAHLWFNGLHPDWGLLITMAGVSAILAGVGLFIGVFFCAVYQRPSREKRFYVFGQIIPGVAIICLFVANMTSNEADISKPKTIAEANEQYVADNSRDSPQMGIAFQMLKSHFNDPNDFKIETSLARIEDTLVHFTHDSAWTITFAYALPKAKLKERYATFVVLGGEARMIRFNRSQAEPEYVRIADQMKSIQHLADSVEKVYDVK